MLTWHTDTHNTIQFKAIQAKHCLLAVLYSTVDGLPPPPPAAAEKALRENPNSGTGLLFRF